MWSNQRGISFIGYFFDILLFIYGTSNAVYSTKYLKRGFWTEKKTLFLSIPGITWDILWKKDPLQQEANFSISYCCAVYDNRVVILF